jgi:hypothetical protein
MRTQLGQVPAQIELDIKTSDAYGSGQSSTLFSTMRAFNLLQTVIVWNKSREFDLVANLTLMDFVDFWIKGVF